MAYQVARFDVSADGMEPLRNQSEFILLAYPDADSGVAELREQWHSDIESADRFDGFDYEAAHAAVDSWLDTDGGAARVERELGSLLAMERRDSEERGETFHEDSAELCPFRLYVETESVS